MSANPASKSQPVSALPPLSGKPMRQVGSTGPLVLLPNRCTGCRTCELACAFAHSEDGNLGLSRIRIHPAGPDRYVQVTCLQCVNAACVQVCPTQALVRNADTGAVCHDENRCVGCGLCETACPFGHMHFAVEMRKPVKCDLCGGRPACAMFCPHEALEWR